MNKITILIADDHTLIRETWSYMLNNDPRFEVIAETQNGEEAVQVAAQKRPDIVIMDINMPGMNGIEATQQIRKFSPGTKILGVSLHTQPAYVRKMMQKGAMGYVTKNSSCDELFKAILELQNKKTYICEEIKNILSDQALNGDENQNGINSLSSRELEVINFIKQGYSSRQIAETLGISIKTVEVHRYNVLKKLNLKNAAALVNYVNNSQLGLGD